MNTFSATAAIRSGWETFKKRPWFFIGIALLTTVLSWLVGQINRGFGTYPDYHIVLFLISLGLSVLIDIGVTAFMLKAAEDPASASVKDLWHPRSYWKYLGVVLLSWIVIIIGFIFLIIPGIILALMYFFVKYLVVTRDLGPIEAMQESVRITKGHLWQLLGFTLLLLLINILGLICLVVGMLVAIPVTALATVHAYRTLEQLASEPVPASTVQG